MQVSYGSWHKEMTSLDPGPRVTCRHESFTMIKWQKKSSTEVDLLKLSYAPAYKSPAMWHNGSLAFTLSLEHPPVTVYQKIPGSNIPSNVAEKPLQLFQWLFMHICERGDYVLELFCGTCPMARAVRFLYISPLAHHTGAFYYKADDNAELIAGQVHQMGGARVVCIDKDQNQIDYAKANMAGTQQVLPTKKGKKAAGGALPLVPPQGPTKTTSWGSTFMVSRLVNPKGSLLYQLKTPAADVNAQAWVAPFKTELRAARKQQKDKNKTAGGVQDGGRVVDSEIVTGHEDRIHDWMGDEEMAEEEGKADEAARPGDGNPVITSGEKRANPGNSDNAGSSTKKAKNGVGPATECSTDRAAWHM
jgi:hypothetical protein